MGFFFKKFGYKKICKQICSFPELIEANTGAVENAYKKLDIDEWQKKSLLRMIEACKGFKYEWQKKKYKKILDYYIKFDECLKNAPESKIIKPEFISDLNLTEKLALRFKVWNLHYSNQDYLTHPKAYRYGVRIMDKKVIFVPIIPDTTDPLNGSDSGYLLHYGTFYYLDEDNKVVEVLKNVRKYGIWGNPDLHHPTYLQRVNANVATFGSYYKTGSPKVILFVDKEKLLAKRNVFIDPEMVMHLEGPPTGELIGNSYIVLVRGRARTLAG